MKFEAKFLSMTNDSTVSEAPKLLLLSNMDKQKIPPTMEPRSFFLHFIWTEARIPGQQISKELS